jgi:hypothetical protein
MARGSSLHPALYGAGVGLLGALLLGGWVWALWFSGGDLGRVRATPIQITAI